MAKLNDTKISKLRWDASKRTKSGKVPQFQWESDTEIGGLHVRIYPPKANGQSNKVFYLKYGPDVARKVYRIGSWGDPWTLEYARDEAKGIRKAFLLKGMDPNQAKKQNLQQAKTSLTVSELLAKYFDEHVSLWSKKYLQSNTTYRRYLENDLGKRIHTTGLGF